jgi:hypothetical protein
MPPLPRPNTVSAHLKGEKLKRIRSFLSFSNVIAVMALFFALGGTVYAAGKISGAEIKPKSIPGNRVKPKSLTGKEIKPGSLTGQEVVESSLAGVSASSLATVQYVVTTVPFPPRPEPEGLAPGVTGTAACPVGQKVIGGGAVLSSDADSIVNDSGPTADRSGWTATGFNFGGAGLSMVVTAICTPVVTAAG